MKPCNETLYYIFFQSHCLCSIQEVCQTEFCLLSRKSKCQFLLVLRIGNGDIEEVISLLVSLPFGCCKFVVEQVKELIYLIHP